MRWIKLVSIVAVGTALALPASAAAKLRAPHLVGPANGARYQELPAISWGGVRGAAEYEYEISADGHFRSIVNPGLFAGATSTHNLAATLGVVVPDGRYWWRVRAVSAKGAAGAWSRTRVIVKRWSTAPRLLGPNGATISWPATPLVLSWSSVPYAVKYIVTIASDPGLSNQVVGSPSQPQYTDGTSFVLPGTLANGTYYWAITPVDAENHRGVQSQVGSFIWSWPTATTVSPVSGQSLNPLFSWNAVPGAAKYEVQVNTSPSFPGGSQWCCTNPTIGTSLAPQQQLANNSTYWWRMRAIDENGNAGQWNYGNSFTTQFDPPSVPTPPSCHFPGPSETVPNLTLADPVNNLCAIQGISSSQQQPPSTDTPLITWSPVPGAARYEVEVADWIGTYPNQYCDWASSSLYHVQTATTGWTPLGDPGQYRPGPSAWPSPQIDFQPPPPGSTYCVRVAARADDDAQARQVISAWSYVNATDDANLPAFTYLNHTPSAGWQTFMTNGDYVLPTTGSSSQLPPILTWNWTPGAVGYFVVIAHDPSFTNVADVAYTNVPAYAPRLGDSEPLADQFSAYYWAVIPVQSISQFVLGFNDSICTYPGQSSCSQPLQFSKLSNPPAPLAPGNGTSVSTWPTFQWTGVLNARNYTLQVSADPSFGSLIDNITTDATTYTSSSTYPADVTLYWRVRGNDWIGQGLNWSAAQTFTRTLPVPAPSTGNPASGELEPTLSWSGVPGAVAYDVHVDEGNGFSQDWTVDSTAVSPTYHYGIGTTFWQVRALFPAAFGGTVGGGFFGRQPYLLTLAPPRGARGSKSGRRLIVAWSPDPAAKAYEVQLSMTDSFSSTLASGRVDGNSWAPDVDYALPGARGTLYWRVAAISSDGITVGSYANGSFQGPSRRKRKKRHH